MSTEVDFNAIKGQTLLALPDDNSYLFRLGVALYGFASLSSFMAEIACRLDSNLDRQQVEAGTGGMILDTFRQTIAATRKRDVNIGKIGRVAADMFETLNTHRSDFAHAYSVTSNGIQTLHRRNDSKGKYFEVTNNFLDDFISRLHHVSNKLYEIRAIVDKR